ncbi:MAG: hypothetical protein MJZ34_03120 [Paludibacteraceae bacterium]|nr:hypothetical protein [Paludibacteraceae bacterium]
MKSRVKSLLSKTDIKNLAENSSLLLDCSEVRYCDNIFTLLYRLTSRHISSMNLYNTVLTGFIQDHAEKTQNELYEDEYSYIDESGKTCLIIIRNGYLYLSIICKGHEPSYTLDDVRVPFRYLCLNKKNLEKISRTALKTVDTYLKTLEDDVVPNLQKKNIMLDMYQRVFVDIPRIKICVKAKTFYTFDVECYLATINYPENSMIHINTFSYKTHIRIITKYVNTVQNIWTKCLEGLCSIEGTFVIGNKIYNWTDNK